jgi:Family of unknown function (DUF6600)/FecR protein
VSNRNSAAIAVLSLMALLVALVLCPSAQADDNPTSYSYARIVRLSYVQGDVQIVRADKSGKWEPAIMNMPVEQGFAIGTNEGRAEVEFEHGSLVWLAPNSVVQFTELALSSGGRITRMTLSEGVATFDANLSAGDTFEVVTPTFTVTAGKTAEFRTGVRQKDAAVSVMNGKVALSGIPDARELKKGEMFVDEPKKNPAIAVMRSPAPDDWDHWVSGRLTAERNGQNAAALSANAPFSYGMADLADYGSWNYFPGLGYGWQPFGMTAGWAPFTAGQWMFYPTFGWTWVSAEAWGWVPYHFGGWEYSSAFGWVWMPGDYGTWAAAPVRWYSLGNHVGWAPRGVSVVHAGSVATPVIVTTKKLGKEGKNEVFSAGEIASRMQSLKMHSLAAAPQENGKPWTAGARESTARVVVPTAANLGGLRAGLAANTGTRVNVNALHEAALPHAGIRAVPPRGFTAVNGAVAAPRLPNRPPTRATFGPPRTGGFGNAGNYEAGRPMPGAANQGMGMQSPGRTAAAPPPVAPAPSATAHPSGGPGRPR